MANWEDALLAEQVQEESTPIFDALFLEYREKMWHRVHGMVLQTAEQEEQS